jgi:hypothetical protein
LDTIQDTVALYVDAVYQFGPDSPEARKIRRNKDWDAELVRFADAIDRKWRERMASEILTYGQKVTYHDPSSGRFETALFLDHEPPPNQDKVRLVFRDGQQTVVVPNVEKHPTDFGAYHVPERNPKIKALEDQGRMMDEEDAKIQ